MRGGEGGGGRAPRMATHKVILLATLAAFALLQLLNSVDGVRSSLPWAEAKLAAASTGAHAAGGGSGGVVAPPPSFSPSLPPSSPPPHRPWGAKRGGGVGAGVSLPANGGGVGRLFRSETPLDAARALALVTVASLAAYVCCRTVMPHGGDEPLLPLWHGGGDSDDGEGEHGEDGRHAGGVEGQGAEGRRVPRVVCLHGWRASAAFMEHQLLVLGLGPADLHPTFLQAPKECAEAFDPMVVAKDGEVYHYWFDFADDNGRTTVDEQSHDLGQARDWVIGEMAKLVASSGRGIDGILGFSQGACVAAEVVATLSAWRADQGPAPPSAAVPPPSLLKRLPRFAVCLSGVCPEALLGMPAAEARVLPVPCPSFHTVGRRDPYAEQSEGLCDLFAPSSATLVRHDGGHEFASEVPVGQQLRVWLGTVGRHASRFLSAATTAASSATVPPPPPPQLLLAQQQQQQHAEEAVEEMLSSSGGTRHRRTHEHDGPDDG